MFFFGDVTLDAQAACRAVGLLGLGMLLLTFFCQGIGKVTRSRPHFVALALVVVGFGMASLLDNFDLSSVMVIAFFGVLSLSAIAIRSHVWQSSGPFSGK